MFIFSVNICIVNSLETSVGRGRPGLVIFTAVVSAFDISLPQVSGGRMAVLASWLRIDLREVCFSRM